MCRQENPIVYVCVHGCVCMFIVSVKEAHVPVAGGQSSSSGVLFQQLSTFLKI